MSGFRRTPGTGLLIVAAAATTLCGLVANLAVAPPGAEAAASAIHGAPVDRFNDRNQDRAVPARTDPATAPPDDQADREIVQASHVAIARRDMQAVPQKQPQRHQIQQRPDAAAAAAAAEENASRYPDIPQAPFGIRATMSPLAQALQHELMHQDYAAFKAQYYEEMRQKLREKQKTWQGTMAEVSQHPDVTIFERLSAARFVKLFESDPPAPEVRKQHFAAFFRPDAEQRCVSWRLALKSAREVDDGWLVDLEAHVNLLGPGFAISFGTTNEIWRVSRGLELTFVEGSPGEDEPARINCRP